MDQQGFPAPASAWQLCCWSRKLWTQQRAGLWDEAEQGSFSTNLPGEESAWQSHLQPFYLI